MRKTILLLIFSIASVAVDGQMATKNKEKQEESFEAMSLPALPLEIWDYIAQFLTFKDTEEEWEFLERLHGERFKFKSPSFLAIKSLGTTIVHSPSGALLAALSSEKARCSDSITSRVTEFTLSTISISGSSTSFSSRLHFLTIDNQIRGHIILGDYKQIHALAISDHGYVAFLVEKFKNPTHKQPPPLYLIFLKTSLLHTYESESEFSSSPNSVPRFGLSLHTTDIILNMAFNKQNTGLGIQYLSPEEKQETSAVYWLPEEVQNKTVQKKNIERWFQQRGVCKKFSQQYANYFEEK